MELFSPVMVLRHGTKTNGTINYTYDAAGNRESKSNTFDGQGTDYYVRDAQGNTLAVYKIAPNSAGTFWREQHLYGSSRLGIWKPNINITSSGTGAWKLAGLKQYELTNHLGNVLAVVSDKRRGVDANADGVIDYYNPDVLSAQDYYPGGMPMPGRSFTAVGSSSYRFGFNGKENDNEVKGNGNQQDYGMRIYDTRLVRFLSVDPITSSYPMLTPYQFASNTPIQAIDLDGLEAFIIHGTQQGVKGIDLNKSTLSQLSRISGHSSESFNNSFRWKEANFLKILNTSWHRKQAAQRLVEHIVKIRAEMIESKIITSDEGITLIGYSHGGNVAIQASKMLNRKFGTQVNLITLSTPAYNTANDEDARNPGIFRHIQIVHKNDNVVNLAGAVETFDNFRTKNYVISENDIPLNGGLEAHTEVYKQSGYSKFMEGIKKISMAPAPKNLDDK